MILSSVIHLLNNDPDGAAAHCCANNERGLMLGLAA